MSNETRQTAVEWLYLEIYKFLNGKSEFQDANDILQQAKEMEKEQIIDAWSNGFDEDDRATSNPFKYYNETYGGNK